MKKFLATLILISLAFSVGELALAQDAGEIITYPEVPVFETIRRVGDIIFTLLLVISVIFFLIAGIMFVSAAGSETQLTKARNMLLYGVIGIIIAVLAKGIVSLIYTYLA